MGGLKTLLKSVTKIDIVFIVVIALITYISWNGILRQTIEGEGYYYFSPTNSFILPNGKVTDILHNLDNFSRFFTYILEQLFGGDIQPYMTAQFIIVVLLNIAIYLCIKTITKKSWLALIAALYFSINYTGNFQFYARGHFQWFTQRVPEVFPTLASIVYLAKFVDQRTIRNYLVSLGFFTMALFMAHYTTLFLPFFVSFLAATALLGARKKRDRLLYLAFAIPFVVINYLIVSNSSLSIGTIRPNQTLFESILQNQDIVNKISFQLVVVTIPYSLLQLLAQLAKQSYQQLINTLMVPIYLFYIAAAFVLFKKKFPFFHLILACFGGLLGVLFLNVYLGRINVFNEIGQGRYYYIPGLYVGIIFASLIDTILLAHQRRHQFLKYTVVVSLLLLWIIPNTLFIWKKIHDSQRFYTATKVMFRHLNTVKNQLPDGSIVLLPNPPMPTAIDFLKKYYSGPNIKFDYLDTKWKSKVPENFDLAKLFVFVYSEEFDRGGIARMEFISVVDKSEEYRKLLIAN